MRATLQTFKTLIAVTSESVISIAVWAGVLTVIARYILKSSRLFLIFFCWLLLNVMVKLKKKKITMVFEVILIIRTARNGSVRIDSTQVEGN